MKLANILVTIGRQEGLVDWLIFATGKLAYREKVQELLKFSEFYISKTGGDFVAIF